MRDSAHPLAALRRRLDRLARPHRPLRAGCFATGHPELDAALGGGLARGRVHELFAAEADDLASAQGFAAMLMLRASGRRQAPLFWLRTDECTRHSGRLQGAGLAELGGDPDSLVLGQAPDIKTLLRSAADAARCPGLEALVVESRGESPLLDLTASRRLALACEQSGVTLFLLRLEASPSPSAADTRWAVAAAPSRPLEGNAPGVPTFDLELLRRRSGPSGMRWRLEWDRDQLAFREPALSGAVVPLSSGRPVAQPNPLRLRA